MKKLFLSTLLLLLLVNFCEAQFTLKDSLYAYYPFNGNAKDESGHGHDPSYNSATLTRDKDGHLNNAYAFGGSDSIIIKNFNYWNGTISGLTVSFWIKTAGASTTTDILTASPCVFYIDRFSSDKIMAAFDANSQNNAATDQTSTSFNTNTWMHVVGTNDGTTTKLYVNGNYEKSYSEILYNHTTNNKFMMGYFHSPPVGLTGSLDEIRVYTRALSASEVNSLYALGTPSGIDERPLQINAGVYPNPSANGLFEINFGKTLTNLNISVRDMAGKVVYENSGNECINYTLNLGNCAKGIYFLNIQSAEGTVSKKIVIQ
jgi:hypothetical protein